MKYFVLRSVFVLSLCAILAPAQGRDEITKEHIQPLITTSELVIGTNRFAFGLLKGNKLLNDAEVALKLYAIDGTEASLVAELQVPYLNASNLKQEVSVHRHQDGIEHVHNAESEIDGLYVTHLSFPRAGDWGIELLIKQGTGSVEKLGIAVTVLKAPLTPAVGSPAPRSRNLIASDVKDLREIDTSPQLDRRLHQIRIADAIERKPQLIVFATPQFCTSRMCAPVVDIVRTLLPTYGQRVAFTHQEIWQDFATKKAFATVDEWDLNTEPWIFVVDREGFIRAKFEGFVTRREIEDALQQVLKQPQKQRQ